jgi:alpha-mannosidase
MSLTPEWRQRIDHWRNEMPRHFYRSLGAVAFEGLVTDEQLTLAEVVERPSVLMPPGTPWGSKWQYGWFRGRVVLPREAVGQRIVLRADVGGESAVYVNGVAAGAVDRQHREITLSADAEPGARYDLLIEAYAGHGPRVSTVGPVPPDRESVPEPPAQQAVVGESSYGIWEESIYQLWLDVETLYQIREHIDPESLRVAEIDRGLREMTLIVDFELPQGEMRATVAAARERLAPLLACVNGSSMPTMYMFGHAHIDVAWLWPLAETERKCVRTFGTQLELLEQYPEYRFLQSQAHLYWMVQRHYPDLYERIQEAVREGRWLPEGGMWVEADTNISGGESLIRQFLHGKRFFREEFGVECQLLWLPDVFGYSGNMPQIMRGCGIRYFSTAKIFWAYGGGEPFPYNTFTWEGIDGSEVLVHLCNNYNAQTDPGSVIERWRERVQKDGISARLYPFGWGDGGGGPTRDHLEYLRRLGDLEGVPRTRMAHPLEFFKDLECQGIPKARYVGELYFQAHRGTYTSQAKTKRGNRKSELALREAEMWAVAAQALADYRAPLDTLERDWKKVLLNQFHDIIPGSSIHRVYEEAETAYAQVIESAGEIADEARGSLTDDTASLTVFNALNWSRTGLVPLPPGCAGARRADGQPLPTQRNGDELLVEVVVPPCGWTGLELVSEEGSAPNWGGLSALPAALENEWLRVALNDRGELTSIYDKELGRELAAGLCNRMEMFKDVPARFDAWDIDSMYALTPVPLEEHATVEVLSSGPLEARLRVTRRLHQSTLTQEICLRRGSRRVDFHTVIDWQERHKLLKVAFPVQIHAHEAIHEIQFGHIKRPNHASRPFDADRYEVAQHKWTALAEADRGVTILNDCKYGVSVLGNTIRLTLLKAALAPDMTADRGRQEFTYSLYAWTGSLAESELVRQGYDLNCPLTTASGYAAERSLFSVDAPNVIMETVKPAEDGSGDIIVRLYESKCMATRCVLTTSLPVTGAQETDMLERRVASLACDGGRIPLELRPFQVLTVRLTL